MLWGLQPHSASARRRLTASSSCSADGTGLSLVDHKRGRPEGHHVLDEKREEIVRATINGTARRYRNWSGTCGRPNSQIDDLLPWTYIAVPEIKAVA